MDSETVEDGGRPLEVELDILAQQPRINRLYTQITFCFKLTNDSQSLQSGIINTLNTGLERLTASYPWVAGTVVNDNGIFKIRASAQAPCVVVKDFRNEPDFPTWDAVSSSNFPFSMLDEDVIAPCKTLVDTDPSTSSLPVFLVQANYIQGGLLLSINGHHGTMDMAGQAQVMHLFAKACRSEPFTSSEIAVGNMDRRTVIDLLDDDKDDDDDHIKDDATDPLLKTRQGQPRQPDLPGKLVWSYFAFSADSLAALKALAMKTVPTDHFVSTDDVLSAFTWQSICRARAARLNPPNPASTLSRNVDMRRYLSLPPTYPGFVTHSTTHTSLIDELVEEPLGSVAVCLRSALDGPTLTRQIRLQATRISRGEDKVAFTNSSVPELDVRLSSWVKEDCYGLDFGFGKPDAVRRPRFAHGAREGLVYFLPKSPQGEIVVGMCLRQDDVERVKMEEQFVQFGSYIG